MTQDEILEMFRHEAAGLPPEATPAHETILVLADLLAESRGRLSKENFETLVHVGAVLYRAGAEQFNARQDVADIMQHSARPQNE
ncbi:hypothetical protein [Noviherbaspirillum aridicola]|uniref:Uncharacterized protein n=1 Tax=Noviherbaspirillum aridicola TaxID=2849687 RepID=A0ABQ4PZP6_9BURK|nr:hypothetical protein [Noviherbaspirillum aridicola]GIZ50267.1 hypothetical protein NCCP691_02810 [Noviherbaspirillum aridicola]